ncbi:DUF3553 domain-containing protein [Pseudohalocynthiibacter aestuariivivens]|nr:DUF3553 domain-containing protein [Pseudohalocynthiibacter aestuariivivens]QIE44230.1 DUF3553 domain-containing protein [Pseudohalocynthiibacter aestuariivivens]
MNDMSAFLAPGMRVEHPGQPDWGVGQVQSNIAGKVTVNFPNAGKVVVDAARVELRPFIEP